MLDKISRQEKNIKEFMRGTSVEVTPGGARAIEDFSEILRPGTIVYVTFLPGSDFNSTVETVSRLKREGFYPIPHFAARVRYHIVRYLS